MTQMQSMRSSSKICVARRRFDLSPAIQILSSRDDLTERLKQQSVQWNDLIHAKLEFFGIEFPSMQLDSFEDQMKRADVPIDTIEELSYLVNRELTRLLPWTCSVSHDDVQLRGHLVVNQFHVILEVYEFRTPLMEVEGPLLAEC